MNQRMDDQGFKSWLKEQTPTLRAWGAALRKWGPAIFDALIWQKLIWATQSVNVWLYQGNADESVSGRSYRLRNHRFGGWFWGSQRKAINWFFRTFFRQADHCKKAYEAEFAKRVFLK